MQPNLTLKNGQTIPLMDDTYDVILRIISNNVSDIQPATSIEELETEFANLFSSVDLTVDDLIKERAEESEREKRKMRMFD